MTRRMTNDEALDLLEVVFEAGPDMIATGMVEAIIFDMDVSRARTDIDSFLAMRPGNINPDSIEIHPDQSDETDMPMVRIVLKTEG